VIAAMIAGTLLTHVVLLRTCAGPPAPRLLLSITGGVIAAGVAGFMSLI